MREGRNTWNFFFFRAKKTSLLAPFNSYPSHSLQQLCLLGTHPCMTCFGFLSPLGGRAVVKEQKTLLQPCKEKL